MTTLLVISDLHLGGAEGFQMCSPEGCARLGKFIDWASGLRDVHLVLNGDVVDFLAEADDSGAYAAFNSEKNALRKLNGIATTFSPFFDALRRFPAADRKLTILLGNHDIELSLPAVRARLAELLGSAPAFLYDNEALVVGSVLIEHGNRYDGWNAVDHDALRQVRSRLSRKESADVMSVQPGSELVAQVMNPIKRTYAFVDLLKPETEAVLPILAVLDPALAAKAAPVFEKKLRSWYRGRLDDEGVPLSPGLVAASKGTVALETGSAGEPDLLTAEDRAAFDLARELAARAGEGGGEVSLREHAVDLLLKAFRHWRTNADQIFDIAYESPQYLEPATRLASRGFEAVVFGHTHHAKKVPLPGGRVYLNSGTWADLMRLPPSVYEGDEKAGTAALSDFMDRVKKNDIRGYRRQVPTFVRIELGDSGKVRESNVFLFDEERGPVEATTEILREKLA